jgi:hypothetical protein
MRIGMDKTRGTRTAGMAGLVPLSLELHMVIIVCLGRMARPEWNG